MAVGNVVLVLADDHDLHADAVVLALGSLGCQVFRIDPRLCQFPDELVVDCLLESSHSVLQLKHGKRTLRSEQIKSVFCRSWDFGEPPPPGQELSSLVAFQERVAALKSFFLLIPEEKWVNHPYKEDALGLKLNQAVAAKGQGFLVPDLYLGNSAERVRGFTRESDAGTVIKQISDCSFATGNETTEVFHGFFTEVFELSNDDALGPSLELAPIFLQRQIHPKTDLRMTVVGETVFAATLSLGPTDRGVVDIRKSLGQIDRRYPVNRRLAGRLCGMMRMWGLKFCAFDFLIGPDEELWFLEANPNGNWAWMPSVEREITEEVATLLAR
jgi:hypothetical protein